jgi:hypothetical protein
LKDGSVEVRYIDAERGKVMLSLSSLLRGGASKT